MTFSISNQADAFKLALPLYDYLSQHGHAKESESLSQIVDTCFSSDAQARKVHLQAYGQIKDKVHDLPPQYKHALDAALEILAENE